MEAGSCVPSQADASVGDDVWLPCLTLGVASDPRHRHWEPPGCLAAEPLGRPVLPPSLRGAVCPASPQREPPGAQVVLVQPRVPPPLHALACRGHAGLPSPHGPCVWVRSRAYTPLPSPLRPRPCSQERLSSSRTTGHRASRRAWAAISLCVLRESGRFP